MTRGITTLPEPMQRAILRLQPEGPLSKKALDRKISRAIKMAREPHRLAGHRTQEMFKQLTTSMGAFKLIKEEDAGDVTTKGLNVKIPDFRVVLPDEATWLIEVKNYYGSPMKPFSMTKPYLAQHLRYANLCGHELHFAIYWGRANVWTLVPAGAFDDSGAKLRLDLRDALTANEMFYLGDKNLAAGYPLSWHLDVRAERAAGARSAEQYKFTILDASIRCRGRILKTAKERELAYLFMFFGQWSCDGWRYVETGPEGGYMELSSEPVAEAQSDGGLAAVGSLSSIFSAYYRQVTSSVKPKDVQQPFRPGSLGKLLSPNFDFKGSSLPLAVITLLPKDFDGEVPAWV